MALVSANPFPDTIRIMLEMQEHSPENLFERVSSYKVNRRIYIKH